MSEKEKPIAKEKSQENFIDDDRFSEMMDLEKGKEETTSLMSNPMESSKKKGSLKNPSDKHRKPVDGDSVGTDVSLSELYGEEKTHEHFVDKLSMELNHIKSKYYFF